jgi:hypothetical protein
VKHRCFVSLLALHVSLFQHVPLNQLLVERWVTKGLTALSFQSYGMSKGCVSNIIMLISIFFCLFETGKVRLCAQERLARRQRCPAAAAVARRVPACCPPSTLTLLQVMMTQKSLLQCRVRLLCVTPYVRLRSWRIGGHLQSSHSRTRSHKLSRNWQQVQIFVVKVSVNQFAASPSLCFALCGRELACLFVYWLLP